MEKILVSIWYDIAIEEVLRTAKTAGGLTHSRGFAGSVLARLVTTMPETSQIIDVIKTFSRIFFESSETLVKLRDTRQAMVKQDAEKMVHWLRSHIFFFSLEAAWIFSFFNSLV